VIPATLLDNISGSSFGPNRCHHYAANPTLEGYAPATHHVDFADMFTLTQEVLPLSFGDALVEANEEVQAYLCHGGGLIEVFPHATIHLGHFAPSEDDSTPFTERHHVRSDGSFSMLDGIRICPEGVWIDRLGMSFSLVVHSLAMEAVDDPEFGTVVDLSLDATMKPLNERLVFS
jgi:hypothetical protein